MIIGVILGVHKIGLWEMIIKIVDKKVKMLVEYTNNIVSGLVAVGAVGGTVGGHLLRNAPKFTCAEHCHFSCTIIVQLLQLSYTYKMINNKLIN